MDRAAFSVLVLLGLLLEATPCDAWRHRYTRNSPADPGTVLNRAGNHFLAPSSGIDLSYVHDQEPEQPCDACVGLLNYPAIMASTGMAWPITFCILWGSFLIWFLNSTAQDFFLPPLVYWSRRLRLSPELAGATLVALGNAAPDVFDVLVAIMSAEDLALGMTEMLGSTMCVLCVTGGAVLFCCCSDETFSAKEVRRMSAEFPIRHAPEVPKVGWTTLFFFGVSFAWIGRLIAMNSVSTVQGAVMPLMYLFYVGALIGSSYYCRQPGDELAYCEKEDHDTSVCPPLAGLSLEPGSSWGWTALWALMLPTYVFRHALIPPSDERWDFSRRLCCSLCPISSVALIFASDMGGVHEVSVFFRLVLVGSASAASLAVFYCTDNGPGLPFFYPSMTLAAKISSVLVLACIAGEVNALVETVGEVFHIPRLWLATTFLPWGGSLGDLATGIAMALNGQASLAYVSILTGPLCNCLLGAGCALVVAARHGGGSVIVAPNGSQRGLLVSCAFIAVAFAILAGMISSGKAPQRIWAYFLFVFYAVFLSVLLTIEHISPAQMLHSMLETR